MLVDGSPSLSCDFVLGRPGSASAEGMIGTTMRIVNAVPFVCDAAPGLVSSLDLPLTLPANAFR